MGRLLKSRAGDREGATINCSASVFRLFGNASPCGHGVSVAQVNLATMLRYSRRALCGVWQMCFVAGDFKFEYWGRSRVRCIPTNLPRKYNQSNKPTSDTENPTDIMLGHLFREEW